MELLVEGGGNDRHSDSQSWRLHTVAGLLGIHTPIPLLIASAKLQRKNNLAEKAVLINNKKPLTTDGEGLYV